MRGPRLLLIAGATLWAAAAAAASLWPADVAWYTNGERTVTQALMDGAEATDRNRIFLVGSSSVLFGYSAGEIEAATGRPTWNLAIRGGRPVLDSSFEAAIARLRPGDVMVVSDARWVDGVEVTVPYSCLDGAIGDCPPRARPLPELNVVMRLVMEALGISVRRPERDERGDFIFPPFLEGRSPDARNAPAAHPEAANMVARLAAAIRERGACPVLAIPPQLVRGGDEAAWDRALASLRGAGSQGMLPPDQFLLRDPRYFSLDGEHLSAAGREHVTARLAAGLKATAAACLQRA